MVFGVNCFVFNEWFFGGFILKFGGMIMDVFVVMGVKYELFNGWVMDVSVILGYSDIEYIILNIVNLLLGL